MKGIILAGGNGTRLMPCTLAISKQVLPVYDKPMIYYPLATLLLAGIREILIIVDRDSLGLFKKMLGSGERFGVSISYEVQSQPDGIAQAFIIGKDFVSSSPSCLILGDNLFHGANLGEILVNARNKGNGATIFAYRVNTPGRYGIVELNKQDGKPISVYEKPTKPKSNLAITGLYFFDENVVEFVKDIAPSQRGELEITSLIEKYMKINQLHVEILGRGHAWLDMGTNDSLHDAASYVRTLTSRHDIKILCPEEIAYRSGYIDEESLLSTIASIGDNHYSQYLKRLID